MRANPLFLLEFILFDGGVLAFCAWQWWTVRPRRESPRDAAASEVDQRADATDRKPPSRAASLPPRAPPPP